MGGAEVPSKKMKHKKGMLFLFLMCLSYSSELNKSKCFAKSNSKIKKKKNFPALKTHLVISLGKDEEEKVGPRTYLAQLTDAQLLSNYQTLLSALCTRTWTSSQKVALSCFYKNNANKIYYTSIQSRNLFVLNKYKGSHSYNHSKRHLFKSNNF